MMRKNEELREARKRASIEACLNCRLPECREGYCQRFHRPNALRKPRKPAALYEMDGERLTLYEWGERVGISPSSLLYRLQHGKTLREAVAMGRNPRITYTVDGRTMTLKSWAAALGLSDNTIRARCSRDRITTEEAIAHYLATRKQG